MLSCFWAPPPCHFWSLLEIHREKSTAGKAAYIHTQAHIIYVTAVTKSSGFSWRVEKSLLKFLLQSLILSIRKRTHTHTQTEELKILWCFKEVIHLRIAFLTDRCRSSNSIHRRQFTGKSASCSPFIRATNHKSHNFTAFSSSHSLYQKKKNK